MRFKVEIFFPILYNFVFEKYPFEQKEIIIKEITSVVKSKGFINKDYIIVTRIDVNLNEESDSLKAQNILKPYLLWLSEEYLSFTISAKVDLSKYVVTSHQGDLVEKITDIDELLNFLPYSLSTVFGDKIFEVLTLSQIAKPGSLKLRDGIIWINGKRQSEIIPSIINLRELFELYADRKYPNIEFLDFRKYYTWLKKNNLLFDESCKNSYTKALNNFTHLNGDTNPYSNIIFLMMTLEQLYTNSNHQIAEQLDLRIQLYLGNMNSYKKQIKNMYSIRSRFLHGDMPISPLHKQDGAEIPKHETELFDAYKLSVVLVISTLQKMYKDNLVDLQFEYILTKTATTK